MKKDKISIIIPVYNAEKYIDECIEAVTNQSYSNLEIIIIDDGSTDNSYMICKKWQKKDKRIILKKNTNHGVSYSRNIAIKIAKGEYLTFIDADDVVSVNFIENLYNNIVDYHADCSICGIAGFYKNKNEVKKTRDNKKIYKEKKQVMLFNEYGGFLANKMYKNKIIKENSLSLNEKLYISEDLVFNLSYFQFCNEVVYDESIYYYYRQHSNSSYNSLQNEKWFSVLDTYSLILEKYQLEKECKENVIYNLGMCLIEASYRYKKNKGTKDKRIIKKINSLDKMYKKEMKKLNFNHKLKIWIFKYFTELVIIYKRRKLKG